MQREFEKRRARQQHGPGEGVVGEPRLGIRAQQPGEDDARAVGQLDRGTEQRVSRGAETRRGDVPGPRRGVQPVPLPVEGVGGEVDPPRVGAEHGRPVDFLTVDVRSGH